MSRPEYACPRCGQKELCLVVEQMIDVVFMEDDDHDVVEGPYGDMEWTDETRTSCVECGHCGLLSEFTNKGA